MAEHPVDKHVGSRIRQLRALQGMTQTVLGERIGVTFQQVQKYERGANRIGASRLWQMSRVFNVKVSWFFEDMPGRTSGTATKAPAIEIDIFSRREIVSLVNAYYKIRNASVRKALTRLIRALGQSADD